MSRSIKEDYYWRLVMADKDKSTSKPADRPQDKPSREPQKPIRPREGEDEPPPPPGGVPVGPGKGNQGNP